MSARDGSDVTDRHAVEALRAELAAAVGGSADAIVTTTLDGRVRTWNPAAERIYGYMAAEAAGRVIDDLVTPPDKREEMQEIQRQVAAGTDVVELDTVRRRKDGSIVHLALKVTPLRDADGEVIGLTRIARDITERERSRRAVEESERRFRQIVETANEGVWAVDPRGVTTFANARMGEILGVDPAEIEGRPFFDFAVDPAGARERFLDRNARAERIEVQFKHADGSPVDALVSTGPLRGPDGEFRGALAMVVDMTARLRAEREAAEFERQLSQMQRLETVGQLAGGVAHDFNNLLSIILNYAEFVIDQVPEGSLREDLMEIKKAAERAADLTQQLLLFSRQEVSTAETVDLNDLVSDMHSLMARTLGTNVLITVELDAVSATVDAGRSQMEQVLLNLAVNARDAMPNGGRLKISTGLARGDDGDVVRVTVSDTGDGIPDEIRERIFEPFFTTKPKGSGTGLGLATVYGIVTGAGGRIDVESEVGHGTTFRVELPLADGAPEPDRPELPGLDTAKRRTILLVEDEEPMRRMAARILEGAGYEVIVAADGAEALERVAATPHVDLVLTDVVMPQIQGDAVAKAMQRTHPAVPVLFMSGFTDRPGRLPRNAVVLRKPFSAETLLEAVAEAFEAPPGAR